MSELSEKKETAPGCLYLVATPIGNLGDLSSRATETLSKADFIVAEDTRVSLKILNHLGIQKPMVSYHRHNCDVAGEEVIRRIQAGKVCALMTDAGSPGISDPGQKLVERCAESGIEVISIPGPCALITAVSVSGLPTGRFTFEGFLPTNKKNRRSHLESLHMETRTMVFYEAPHRLRATLEDLTDTFGAQRRVVLCRELTKIHEEITRTTLGVALAAYEEREPRGEYVLVVEGQPPVSKEMSSLETALQRICELRQQGDSLNQAVRTVACETNIPKNQLYMQALELEGKTGHGEETEEDIL